MKHGIVSRNSKSLFPYQGWPTVCRDENGTLYAASSGHRLRHVCPFGKNLFYTSTDNGITWSSPTIINDTPLDDRDAGLTYLGGGKLLLMWFNHPREFYYDRDKKTEHTPDLFTAGAYEAWNSLSDEDHIYGSFVKLSTDYGKTWGETYKIPLTAPHGAILLSNGNIMMLGIPFHTSGISSSVYAAVSKDEGKSWEILAKIPDTVGTEKIEYCEAHLAELNDGTLVGAIRYQENDRSQYFTVYTTFSYDGGHTWTPAAPTGICGSPPHLLKLASGELLLTYARRIAPYGQFARISHDGGKTWGDEITLDDNAPDWDEGYPSTVQLDDGSLITVYYQKWADDSYCSILYTKWELPKQ